MSALLSKFNPYRVMGVENHELKHSNTLAWLMDPKGNHGLADYFLKQFMLYVSIYPENELLIKSPYNISRMNLSDASVYREEQNIDILIISETNKIVLLIENKWHSTEGRKQLSTYYDYVSEKYKKYTIIPIFLTLYGDKPSHKAYAIGTYEIISKVLEEADEIYGDNINSNIRQFILYYKDVVKRELGMDEDINRLCKEIYNEHKNAIDLIYSIGNSMDVSLGYGTFKAKFPNIQDVSIRNRDCTFILPEFTESKKMNTGYAAGYPMCYWFSHYSGKLKIHLEVGPFEIPERRVEFLESLNDFGISLSEATKQLGKTFSRLYTKTTEIEDWMNPDEIGQKMINLYSEKKLREIEKNLIKGIRSFRSWN